ncbi:MAG: hypothetical protein R3E79_11380 [Caldilineaceae bacterium]
MTTIPPEKMRQYRATAQDRQRLAAKRLAERLARAQMVIQQAATLLKERYGIAHVAVFGSVAHPQRFHDRSDIDLAVWGLDEHCYYRAVGELQALSPEFGIDLVRGEDAEDTLRQTIEQESVPL